MMVIMAINAANIAAVPNVKRVTNMALSICQMEREARNCACYLMRKTGAITGFWYQKIGIWLKYG
jgi:hypothetical protein